MPSWDPAIYERYKLYRDRPALDLLLQIPADLRPHEVWDLGCGTGEHAALLASRHPHAEVHGLDASPDMLAVARRREARVDWRLGDIAAFAPKAAPDLIFTNAALQWLPDHAALFPHLANLLAPEGVLACQMPMSFDQAWHVALRDLAAEPAWRERLASIAGVRAVATPETYYSWLTPLCAEVDIWATTYIHALEGEDPVVEWMQGTGLRPYLDALSDPVERAAFLDAYADVLAQLMPPGADGHTLLPFPRLFILARR